VVRRLPPLAEKGGDSKKTPSACISSNEGVGGWWMVDVCNNSVVNVMTVGSVSHAVMSLQKIAHQLPCRKVWCGLDPGLIGSGPNRGQCSTILTGCSVRCHRAL